MKKEHRTKKGNKIFKVFSTIFSLLILFVISYYYLPEGIDFEGIFYSSVNTVVVSSRDYNGTAISVLDYSDKLQVYFLDVGQADCEFIYNNGKTMLIDAGNDENGEKIVNFLKYIGISKIDYLIATHVHADHIGGMNDIIDSFEIGKFYMPSTTISTKQFDEVLTSMEKKNLKFSTPNVGDKFFIDNASCEIMCVDSTQTEELNLSSIVIEMRYDNNSFLFTGDAEPFNENSRNWNKVDVLKVAHHGSKSSSGDSFLKQVRPSVAIIEVGKDNDYGFPKQAILNRLEKYGAKIYRTDEDGTILVLSDGNELEVRTGIDSNTN